MYPLVLSKPEVSCMRQMLRVLLATWVRDAVTDFLKVERPLVLSQIGQLLTWLVLGA